MTKEQVTLSRFEEFINSEIKNNPTIIGGQTINESGLKVKIEPNLKYSYIVSMPSMDTEDTKALNKIVENAILGVSSRYELKK